MRTITVDQRRRLLVPRHHLGGGAGSPEEVARALVALHASDPATVYLSVLARSAASTLADVADAMYQRRTLVRWMAMRRTLFVVPVGDAPLVHAAVSIPLAAALRRQLLARIGRDGAEPPVPGDAEAWLDGLAVRVEQAVGARGSATGAQLAADEPALRTVIAARTPSAKPQAITSPLLTLMGTQGSIVRGAPTGTWTSRHHRWEPAQRWWPHGIPALDPGQARRELAHRWLARYGPATMEDLRWWTGWNKTTVREAVEDLRLDEVDLHGRAGVILHEDDLDDADTGPAAPVAALLPALDPTAMGWKDRDWFIGVERRHLFDAAGNIGPTLWWDGQVIGSWATTPTGQIRTAVLSDRGADAERAIEDAAARLHARLDGAVITPATRTPLERSLT